MSVLGWHPWRQRSHETEWERVVRLAEVVVLPPDRFVREDAVGYRLHARVDAEVIRHLARWGNNLINSPAAVRGRRKPWSRQELLEVVSGLLLRSPAAASALQDGDPDAIEVHIDADLEDLVPGFLANRRADVIRLRGYIEAGDFDAARRLGHDLKGVGEPYGFKVLSRVGQRIERAAEAREVAELERAAAGLDDYLTRVRVAVRPTL